MYSWLLIIIYIAFISLGLPDTLLGAAWPVMYEQLNVPISYAGITTMIIAGGTIVSSLMSDHLTRKLGAGLVTASSVLMTAVALLGFSFSNSFILLCLWAVPYGLGAGAVDATLNNYVALHYASRHMNWLHCFWGVGASVSPYIMGYCLAGGYGWPAGYRLVALVQMVLTAMLFLSLPIWQGKNKPALRSETRTAGLSLGQALKIKGVKLILLTFFSYCALEATTGLWVSSYLVEYRQIATETAAKFASLFFLGITFGRFMSGLIADRVGDKMLIRSGLTIIIVGFILVGLPVASNITILAGLVVVGLGCAPVYPSIIHATPANFGEENSQAIIGIQMASAYVGTTFMPPLFGVIAGQINIGLYPIFLLFFAILTLMTSELLNKTLRCDTG
ncbi:MAG: MFS transporter [Pelotomaculum sp.]|jgi:fucose permease